MFDLMNLLHTARFSYFLYIRYS